MSKSKVAAVKQQSSLMETGKIFRQLEERFNFFSVCRIWFHACKLLQFFSGRIRFKMIRLFWGFFLNAGST